MTRGTRTMDSTRDTEPPFARPAHPVADAVSESPATLSLTPRARLVALVVALAGLTILGVARRLSPDPTGIGTHQELGLPPCGFVFTVGIPCPTCGMTTAFSLLAHGHPFSAFRTQPAGCALAIGVVFAVILGLRAALLGRLPAIRWEWLGTNTGLMTIGLAFFGAWAWKIADYLLHR